MTLCLAPPSSDDLAEAGRWRLDDDVRLGLRTARMRSGPEQQAFFEALSRSDSPHRYWSVYDGYPSAQEGGTFRAFVGLTDINWEAGYAEISLLTDGSGGVGGEAVRLVLAEAFGRLRLRYVFGECYEHNPAWGFWKRMLSDHQGGSVRVPGRKWWNGALHGAHIFWFAAEP